MPPASKGTVGWLTLIEQFALVFTPAIQELVKYYNFKKMEISLSNI
jgi:hypothetical protein